jgi:hypothetical protein
MRAQRKFRISFCDQALEVRLSPAAVSAYVMMGTSLADTTSPSAAVDDPMPNPEPSPGPYPGDDPPIIHPELPPSGPAGPGT